MIVVSDSSPLIALARIGELRLLSSLFERILIPSEVHREVVDAGRGLPGSEEVRRASWIEVRPLREQTPLPAGGEGLGAGERGAILLARSIDADLVLLDESKARRVARDAALSVLGCLGVLESAARKGLVPDLRSAYIDLLRQGIRFDIRLLQESLRRLSLPEL